MRVLGGEVFRNTALILLINFGIIQATYGSARGICLRRPAFLGGNTTCNRGKNRSENGSASTRRAARRQAAAKQLPQPSHEQATAAGRLPVHCAWEKAARSC